MVNLLFPGLEFSWPHPCSWKIYPTIFFLANSCLLHHGFRHALSGHSSSLGPLGVVQGLGSESTAFQKCCFFVQTKLQTKLLTVQDRQEYLFQFTKIYLRNLHGFAALLFPSWNHVYSLLLALLFSSVTQIAKWLVQEKAPRSPWSLWCHMCLGSVQFSLGKRFYWCTTW